jgi:hypothetical protein
MEYYQSKICRDTLCEFYTETAVTIKSLDVYCAELNIYSVAFTPCVEMAFKVRALKRALNARYACEN